MNLTSTSARRTGRSFAPAVSGLEGRQLLAGSIFFSGGTLNFYGGDGTSQAEINVSSTNPANIVATIDGVSQEFSATEVKVVMFYSSAEGQDSLVNNTDETTVSFLTGTGNSVMGGTRSDIVIDYSTDESNVDSSGGTLSYIEANDGRPHGVQFRSTSSGGLIVRAY